MLSKGVKNALIVLAALFGIVMLFVGLIVWAVFHFIVAPIAEKQEAQAQAYEDFIANINSKAVAYIEEKYGFVAEVTNTVQDREGSLFGYVPANRGGVYMTYEDTSIFVYYDLDTNIGYDDYQYEIVYAAVEDIFRANGTGFVEMRQESFYGIGTLHLPVANDEMRDECEDLLHVYYDGTNLGEVLAFSGADLAGCYTGGIDFSAYADWQIPETLLTAEGNPITLRFLSFRSEDYPANGDLSKYTQPTAAPYVSSYCCFQNGEAAWNGRFALQDCDGAFQYCVVYPDGADVDDTAVTIKQGNVHDRSLDIADGWDATGDVFYVTATTNCTIYLFFTQAQQQALLPSEKYRFGLAAGDENSAKTCSAEIGLDGYNSMIYSVDIEYPYGAALELFPLHQRPES